MATNKYTGRPKILYDNPCDAYNKAMQDRKQYGTQSTYYSTPEGYHVTSKNTGYTTTPAQNQIRTLKRQIRSAERFEAAGRTVARATKKVIRKAHRTQAA